jgi:hypothetical protein
MRRGMQQQQIWEGIEGEADIAAKDMFTGYSKFWKQVGYLVGWCPSNIYIHFRNLGNSSLSSLTVTITRTL